MSPSPVPDDPLRRLLEFGSTEEIVLVLAGKDPQEVADVLEDMPDEIATRAFEALGTLSQAKILREIDDEDMRDDLIEALSDDELADIAEAQKSDDATDLVDDLPDERRARVMAEIEPERRAEIQELRSYGPETAGGIMQTELLRLDQELTVADAIEVVREEYSPDMGELFDAWVVDGDGRVKGRVRCRQLLISPAQTPIRDIMLRDVHPVPVLMDQEEIVDLVQDYDVASVAVVDETGVLVGRIMVDDILDVMEDEATEDAALQAGTIPEDIYSRSVALTVRARLPWLMATFAGGLVTIVLVASAQDEIERVTLVAAVIPIIAGMSGNVGTQASSVTVRGIALGDVDYGRLGRVIIKELTSGAIFAVLFSIMLYVYVLFVLPIVNPAVTAGSGHDATRVALIPTIAIALTILSGAAMGTLVPLTLHRLGRDPAVASSPFISTMNDLVGISVLTLVARALLA